MLRRPLLFSSACSLRLSSTSLRFCSSSTSQQLPPSASNMSLVDVSLSKNFSQELTALQELATADSRARLEGQRQSTVVGDLRHHQKKKSATSSSSSSSSSAAAIGWFPQARIALLPNTAGRLADSLRMQVMDHPVVAEQLFQEVRGGDGGGDGGVCLAILGQVPTPSKDEENSLISRICRVLVKSSTTDGGANNSAAENNKNKKILIIDKSLDPLLTISRQLPAPLRRHFVLVRAADPYFALLHCAPDRQLQRVLVAFPPPCPSDSESYRRIVHARFLAMAHQKLARGGDVVVATDYRPLHQFHLQETTTSEAWVSWAAPQVVAQRQKGIINKKMVAAAAASIDGELDEATMPRLIDAPPRVRFALEATTTRKSGGGGDSCGIDVLRRFKDMETSEATISANASFVLRRQKFGALKRDAGVFDL